MTNPRTLLSELLKATSEKDVDKILQKFNLTNKDNWKLFGDNPANYNIIDNQQPDPVTALAEKPVNSIDALLLLECKKRGIDPEGKKAPGSMADALKVFFGIDLNKFQDLNADERRDLAQHIFIISEGSRKEPCIKIVDRGEGQRPEDFRDTFLNQQSTLKNSIPFVQGQYSMGGTGVLRFCGERAYQLVLSRKHPKLLEDGQPDKWGFTLIRRHDTSGTGTLYKAEWYEYLVDDSGKIFEIPAEPLKLVDDESPFTFGTCVKVFNYNLGPGLRSTITLDLWRALNRRLFLPIIPLTLFEKRKYRGHSPKKILLGNKHRILIDDRNQLEVDPFTIQVDFGGSLGRRDLWIAVFKEETAQTEFTTHLEAILLTVNGQTMGTLPRSLLSSDAKLSYLKNHMLVHLDCSGLDTHTRRKIFMPSRERMADSDEANKLRDLIIYELRNSQRLADLNEQRRERRIKDSSHEEEDYLKKVFQKLISSNPALTNYLPLGAKVRIPGKGRIAKPKPYKGQYFPTFLRVYRSKADEAPVKRLPVNSYINVKLETDAMNDYLDRETDAGKVIFSSSAHLLSRGALNDGILPLRIGPHKSAKEGDKEEVVVKLTRPHDSALETHFLVEYLKPVKKETRPPGEPKKREESFDLPEPLLVYKDQWQAHGRNWTGADIVSVFEVTKNGKSSLDVEINMEADDLVNYLRSRPKLAPSQQDGVKRFYKMAIVLSSVVLFHQLKDRQDREEWVSNMMKAMTPVLLSLGDSEVTKLLEG